MSHARVVLAAQKLERVGALEREARRRRAVGGFGVGVVGALRFGAEQPVERGVAARELDRAARRVDAEHRARARGGRAEREPARVAAHVEHVARARRDERAQRAPVLALVEEEARLLAERRLDLEAQAVLVHDDWLGSAGSARAARSPSPSAPGFGGVVGGGVVVVGAAVPAVLAEARGRAPPHEPQQRARRGARRRASASASARPRARLASRSAPSTASRWTSSQSADAETTAVSSPYTSATSPESPSPSPLSQR